MTDFKHTDAEEAIKAATAAAFTDADGRTTVHSFTIAGMMLGADWDLAEVISELRTAQEIVWFDDPMRHDLAVKTADGRFYKFEVARPERAA